MSEVLPLTMPDGTVVWALVDIVEDQGPSDVGIGGGPAALRGLQETLRSVAASVRAGLAEAAPGQVSVEFGLQLAVADGGIVAALCGVSGNATIKVTATWGRAAIAGGAENAQPVR